MSKLKIGDRVRVKNRPEWPAPPGYRFADAEGVVVPWVAWTETMEDFGDYTMVRLEKTGEGAREFIGKSEFFLTKYLEKI